MTTVLHNKHFGKLHEIWALKNLLQASKIKSLDQSRWVISLSLPTVSRPRDSGRIIDHLYSQSGCLS